LPFTGHMGSRLALCQRVVTIAISCCGPVTAAMPGGSSADNLSIGVLRHDKYQLMFRI
jgi:hypothetical protein